MSISPRGVASKLIKVALDQQLRSSKAEINSSHGQYSNNYSMYKHQLTEVEHALGSWNLPCIQDDYWAGDIPSHSLASQQTCRQTENCQLIAAVTCLHITARVNTMQLHIYHIPEIQWVTKFGDLVVCLCDCQINIYFPHTIHLEIFTNFATWSH